MVLADLNFMNDILLGYLEITSIDRADRIGFSSLMECYGCPEYSFASTASITNPLEEANNNNIISKTPDDEGQNRVS
jgi:hypothetical protein